MHTEIINWAPLYGLLAAGLVLGSAVIGLIWSYFIGGKPLPKVPFAIFLLIVGCLVALLLIGAGIEANDPRNSPYN